MTIGQVLKEKRKEYQLTQEQLAEKIYVTNRTVSNWETGKTTPDIDSLIRLSALFDLSLDNLLLEGSDIVENIKKIEAAKIAKKYFTFSWLTNIVFVLILGTQKLYGDLSTVAFVLLTLGIILNSFTMFYFAKEVKVTNENKSPYQILKTENKWLLIPVILILVLVLWLTLFAR
ncbi:hypothetical protein BW731_12250 [Vagococcus martis]|uniref:HTH cro/C1-type domain-containing protein n=1 Tax=Vagococcus martis TaxID=1768210 RepID=A0A1V4DEG8_9ENTE|nr:helix-turn-helix transcriptional regulator [Vagococcus martis]OPF86115.1 hypothetical protein BW731_12105 [Vagococcus martis]OPF86130.1 hypothetical protein BW731_12180 [Vagococcus martis]OPF86141.1 hypothetical protein BW731_12250 [Vagococcus martis]